MQLSTSEFTKRAAIAVTLLFLPLAIWALFDLILIATGAALVAMLLSLGSEPFTYWMRLPRPAGLLLSGLFITGIIGGTAYLFGTQLTTDLRQVIEQAGAGIGHLEQALQGSDFGELLLEHVGSGSISVTSMVTPVLNVSMNLLYAAVVIIFLGVYIAVQPSLYRDGFAFLFPRSARENALETAGAIANALRLWLLGQFIDMVLIGLLSALAAWLIGLPSPLGLGVIAGVTAFIPYLGPIIGAIPALLVAATISFKAVLWTVAAYTLIQQAEGHLIMPLVQRSMVYVPPGVMLLGIVVASLLFGIGGMVFAAPLVVIGFVAVKKLYVREQLGEQTAIPGEKEPDDTDSE
ncbi:MAG: AI-2E family transporter [Xanthobacteraceae bacterium]